MSNDHNMTLSEEFSVKVGTGETRTDGDKQVGVFKTYRTHPTSWNDDVLARIIQLGLNRIAGQLLNTVPVEKGMKSAALGRIIEEMNAGETPAELLGQRAGARLDTVESRIVDLAIKDLSNVGREAAIRAKVAGTGKNGKIIAADVLAFLNDHPTLGDLVRAAGDGLAFDRPAVLDWAEDDARKRDYRADAEAELAKEREEAEALDAMSADDLLGDL